MKRLFAVFILLLVVACGGGGSGAGTPGPTGPAGATGPQGDPGVAPIATGTTPSSTDKISVVSGTLAPDSGVPGSEAAGATVYAVGQQGSGTTTDANGSYTLTVDLNSASQIAVVQKPLLQRIVGWLKGDPKAATAFTQVGLVAISSTNAHGKKINVNLQDGTAVNLPNITITKVGKISGNVKLQNAADHTGIMVYIPGTSFLALTDAAGNFTITNVPEGDYNYLRASISGYKHSMLSTIAVASNTTTTVRDQLLLIDTGATGSILINTGAAVSANKQVTVNVAASSTAILMLYSESSIFLNAAWEPLQSSFTYTFDTEGAKTLYIKFADANGLESPVYSDSITVNSNWTAPLTAPSTGARTNDTTPTFSWTADALAATYDLVISKNADLSTPDLTVTGIAAATNTLTAGQALPDSTGQLYYWSVRPVDAIGVAGSYATASSFTLDTTAPTVSSTTPVDAAVSVANTSAVSAVFGEDMDSLSIGGSTLTLLAGSTAVTGTVSYDSASKTASFTPAANLAGTTAYTATLTTGMKDAAGNAIAANYPWSFTTAAGWVFPAGLADHLSNGSVGVSSAYASAMNASGDIVVGWAGYGEADGACNGQCFNMYVARYKKSTRTWTLPAANTDHLNPVGGQCGYPQVAIDAAGNIVAAWAQYVVVAGSGYNQIYRAQYIVGTGLWTKPADATVKINPGATASTNAYSPSLALDPATGQAIIAWTQNDGNGGGSIQRVFYSYYNGNGNPATGWTDPANNTNTMIDTTNTISSYYAATSMAGGNLIIAWMTYDHITTFKYSIYALTGTYNGAGASLGVPAAINLAAQSISSQAVSIAMAQDGSQGMVVYQANDAVPKSQIYAATWNGAAWTSPANAADHISFAGTDAYYPKVRYDSTGKAVAVWKQNDNTFLCSYNSCSQIFKATWSGTAWTKPVDLMDNLSPDGQNAGGPDIAFDTLGNGLITWA